MEVVVGLRASSPSNAKAQAAGLKHDRVEGAAWADVVMILTPDELQADLWADDLRDTMRRARPWPLPMA